MNKIIQVIENLEFLQASILASGTRNDAEKRINDTELMNIELQLMSYKFQLNKMKQSEVM